MIRPADYINMIFWYQIFRGISFFSFFLAYLEFFNSVFFREIFQCLKDYYWPNPEFSAKRNLQHCNNISNIAIKLQVLQYYYNLKIIIDQILDWNQPKEIWVSRKCCGSRLRSKFPTSRWHFMRTVVQLGIELYSGFWR